MDITMSSLESIPILRVTGDIDMATAPRFDAALQEHSDGLQMPLVLDLSGCPFLDSGALNVLLQAVRQLGDSAWLGVVGANRNLLRVFDIVALTADPRFRVFDDMSQLPI
jgi:anti-sigma B factor antagonist